jgi:hypothetical protein
MSFVQLDSKFRIILNNLGSFFFLFEWIFWLYIFLDFDCLEELRSETLDRFDNPF